MKPHEYFGSRLKVVERVQLQVLFNRMKIELAWINTCTILIQVVHCVCMKKEFTLYFNLYGVPAVNNS